MSRPSCVYGCSPGSFKTLFPFPFPILFIILNLRSELTTSGPFIALIDMDIETKNKDIQASEPEKFIAQRMENMQLNPRISRPLIDAQSWDFGQIFGVKRHVATITIDQTTTGSIYSFNNSISNVRNLFSNIDISEYFKYIRYNVVFELEVQSHFQQQGSLIAQVLPFATGSNLNSLSEKALITQHGFSYIVYNTRTIDTIFPHDFITFGHSGNYKVVLPWQCNRNMLPTALQSTQAQNSLFNTYYLNSFALKIFEPLSVVASAVNVCSVRIWAHLENLQYSGYLAEY